MTTDPEEALRDRLRPQLSALLLVDVQNDFCHPDGKLGRRPGFDRSGLDEALTRMGEAVEIARAHAIPIIWLQAHYDRRYLAGPALLRRQGQPDAQDLCLEGSWGAALTLAPAPGEPVIVKHRYSGFHETRLAETLQGLGRSSVILAGVTTTTCVMATALEASFRGLYPVILRDAVWAPSPEAGSVFLAEAARLYADVLTLDAWREGVRFPGDRGPG